MSLLSRVLALLGMRREKAPVEASFAPGRSAWRDALIDEGLDARSFPVLHPERESLPRERSAASPPEAARETQRASSQLTAPTPYRPVSREPLAKRSSA